MIHRMEITRGPGRDLMTLFPMSEVISNAELTRYSNPKANSLCGSTHSAKSEHEIDVNDSV